VVTAGTPALATSRSTGRTDLEGQITSPAAVRASSPASGGGGFTRRSGLRRSGAWQEGEQHPDRGVADKSRFMRERPALSFTALANAERQTRITW